MHVLLLLLQLAYPGLLIELLEAVLADTYALVVGKLLDRDEVLCAFATDSSPALSAIVHAQEEAKFFIADVASVNLIARPVRPLSYLQVLNPAHIGAVAHMRLRYRHANQGVLHMLVN